MYTSLNIINLKIVVDKPASLGAFFTRQKRRASSKSQSHVAFKDTQKDASFTTNSID